MHAEQTSIENIQLVKLECRTPFAKHNQLPITYNIHDLLGDISITSFFGEKNRRRLLQTVWTLALLLLY